MTWYFHFQLLEEEVRELEDLIDHFNFEIILYADLLIGICPKWHEILFDQQMRKSRDTRAISQIEVVFLLILV